MKWCLKDMASWSMLKVEFQNIVATFEHEYVMLNVTFLSTRKKERHNNCVKERTDDWKTVLERKKKKIKMWERRKEGKLCEKDRKNEKDKLCEREIKKNKKCQKERKRKTNREKKKETNKKRYKKDKQRKCEKESER